MLRYEIKLGSDDIRREVMEWKEKYLSPDLSYITGVTDSDYHIEKFSRLPATNSIINSDISLELECNNVIRQGYIIVKGKEYDTFSDKFYDYSVEKSGETIDYRYVMNKDKYFYWCKFIDEDKSGYTFNNLLNYDEEKGEVVEKLKFEASKNDEVLKIDTVYWIEDDSVEIDGDKYFYDKNEGDNGILKYGEYGAALEPSAVTRCDDIEFYPYSSSTMYKEVTKFRLSKKNQYEKEEFDNITFASYFYYVKYKNHYCQVKQKYDGDSFSFVCEIPLYVLSATTVLANLETVEFPLYFLMDYSDNGGYIPYEEFCTDEFLMNSDNVNKHFVYNLNDLKNVSSFIYIEKEEKAYFDVEYEVMNSNDGNEIILYMSNTHSPLTEGEKILFKDCDVDTNNFIVYYSSDYGSDIEDDVYVLYNSKKYLVEKNLMDKVMINDNEYDIEYGISGKVENSDCFVTIGLEKVPMSIQSINGGKYSGGTLQRYGMIISGNSNSAITAQYDIKPYSGITINGEKYIIYEENDDNIKYEYASLKLPKTYTFIISKKIGNSTYVCYPDINESEFINEFNRIICNSICNDVVNNQRNYSLNIKNKIFGEKEIEKDLAFIRNNIPESSDDYYDLFSDLILYIKNGYINIPLSFNMDIRGNILQDDIIKRDFFENEKKKSINPIVDMEKDVYIPKFIWGYYDDDGNTVPYGDGDDRMYRGSNTIFKNIYEINFNFHFRTRNLDSWKVNEGDYLYDTSGNCDNWFVTDFFPYYKILQNSGDTLQRTSDLIGLLYFTNDDVFYQRSKIGKSFARLSYYDSTDPQTQSLLGMSCVFMDEHYLYKKYIDNSRRYEMDFGSTSDPRNLSIYKTDKIRVDTEFLGYRSDNISYSSETDANNVKIYENDEHRVSSRLTVSNKHGTAPSSEGFYMYIFREYQENLHPKPIYMKVEFNHAGIGNQIPFLVPMHWDGNTTNTRGTAYNKMYPQHALKLSVEDDIKELKKGIPLSYVYAQTYIPLYAVYDYRNQEYCYVFDDRYIDMNYDNGVLNINMFEMKIMDELNTPTLQQLEDISHNMHRKAIVNVNTKQFDKKAFNYEVE